MVYKMNLEKIFKNLIILDFVILVLAFITGLFIENYEEVPLITADYFSLILIIAYIISLYLLYKFKPIAKSMYVLVNILSVGLIFFYPAGYYPVTSHFEELIYNLSPAVTGAILALLFCTEVSEKFNKK